MLPGPADDKNAAHSVSDSVKDAAENGVSYPFLFTAVLVKFLVLSGFEFTKNDLES